VQLPHFSAPAHVVHQVESVSFAANESHYTLTSLNLPVVYCTSTTGFNIRFLQSGKFAAKELSQLLRIRKFFVGLVEVPRFTRNCAIEEQDTGAGATALITFLALFHLFSACMALRI
jgi:hypothetical protein